MQITKNTYGVTTLFHGRTGKIGELSGSSLERHSQTEKEFIQQLLNKPLFPNAESKERLSKAMSNRTKSKIRKKIIAFSRLFKHLSFLTLTFVNLIEQQQAVKILGKFLDNVKKSFPSFQFIWVAEKQKRNTIFPNNIHFHVISNIYWNVDKWWTYWLALQAKNGIKPRTEGFKPSSAFDVKHISTQNIKGISSYLTSYVTKNHDEFICQIWNCSKKISMLKTHMYEDESFLKTLDDLETNNMLNGPRKIYLEKYYSVHTYPLNRTTLRLFDRIDSVNNKMWQEDKNIK